MIMMMKDKDQKKRCSLLLSRMAAVVLAGLGYALFCIKTGWYIPCILRLYTGYRCPGCGVSHMCTSLLQLKFSEAFRYNPAVFLMLPALGVLGLQLCITYIRDGKPRLSRGYSFLAGGMVVVLVIFGIVRNILGF